MNWHQHLQCPRCGTPVEHIDGRFRCTACPRRFPVVGGIPVVLAEPERAIQNWSYRVSDFIRDNLDVRAKLLAELATDARVPATRRRLEDLHRHLDISRGRIVKIMQDAGVPPVDRATPDLATVIGEETITAYYHQIHRDWSWEQHANQEAMQAVKLVEAVCDKDKPLGRMLVLGAGACRLAIELHRRLDTKLTVALDLNPLPFLVARDLLAGVRVELYEFPVRPVLSDDAFVDRVLSLSGTPPQNFHLLFADGLKPPFAPGSFDTILTPWFIDQVPTNLAELIPTLREMLAPGGQWLNHGPLIYQPTHTRIVHRYCADEVLQLVESEGFEVADSRRDRIDYMVSPIGSQGRTETVLTFRAHRTERAQLAEPESATLAFLSDVTLAVPRLEGMDDYQAPHPLFGAIVRLVDGNRSTQDIARVLVDTAGIPESAAEGGVQAALREIVRKLS